MKYVILIPWSYLSLICPIRSTSKNDYIGYLRFTKSTKSNIELPVPKNLHNRIQTHVTRIIANGEKIGKHY